MVVKVFCGDEFSEHEHEWNQFKEVYNLICEKYAKSDEVIYILSNFLLSNAQIDVAILTGKGPVILELKSYKGEIRGSENGSWTVITENGNDVQLSVNLFQQLKTQKFAFLKKLNSIRTGNFEHIESESLARIKCWGYFEKRSTYDVSQVGGGVHLWFDVITANNLIEKLRFVNARYLLRPVDMDAIVKGLKLKEYGAFTQTEDSKPLEKPSTIERVIKKHLDSENIVMLDAIYQWATNPTSMSAINKGAKPNHEYAIKRNLSIRYGEEGDFEKVVETLRQDISKSGIDFDVAYLNVKDEIIKIFDDNSVLFDTIVIKLSEVSDLDKIIVWLYAKTSNLFPYSDEYSDYTLEKMNKLKALFSAISGSKPPDDMISVLIKLGFLNRLAYTNSKLTRYHDNYVEPEYIHKLINDIDDYISLSQSPDFKNYIDSLFLNNKYEQLRVIDELSKKDNGVVRESELSGRLIPKKGILSNYHEYVAISPLILKDLKMYLNKTKNKCLSIHTDIEHALDTLSAKYPQEIGVTPQSYFSLDYEWEIRCDETLGIGQGFYVLLASWIIGNDEVKNPSELLKRISEKTEYAILILTNHDIPNLIHLIGEDKSLNLMILHVDENKIYVKCVGSRHMLLDAFLEELEKIKYEIHNVGMQK